MPVAVGVRALACGKDMKGVTGSSEREGVSDITLKMCGSEAIDFEVSAVQDYEKNRLLHCSHPLQKRK